MAGCDSAILLAAGRSSRMGMPKGLLPWKGTTLIEYQVRQLLESKAKDVVIVLGHEPERYSSLAIRYPVKVVWNPFFDQGKTSSILAGLKATDVTTESITIAAVDQPVTSHLINRLITVMKTTDSLITIPIYQGKRGHPVLFSKYMVQKLLMINEKTCGLRQVLQDCKDQVTEVTVEDPAVLYNMNTQADYLDVHERRNGFEDIPN